MIDEKQVIKKLESRIDYFVKSHPEKNGCHEVQVIREFIHMLESEGKKREVIKN